MNRKNTILLAVLINAGLLVALLITALVGQEEDTTTPSLVKQETKEPLFIDEIELAIKPPASSAQETLPQVVQPLATSPVAHPLPSLQPPEAPPVAVTPSLPSAPVIVAAPATPAPAASWKQVVVKKGDSLDKIARQHKTTVEEILQLNELSSSFLRVGQVLKVKASEKKAPSKPLSSQETAYYTVKVGDSPWTIAQKHHLKVEELLKLNSLNDAKARKLKPGDRLRVK
jgi:peptidoglycan endopeptidase LytF